MIGFYDYTVVVTYISLISSIIGIFMAIEGRMQLAVFCLAFSGLCDMFDGKIARTKKNRTEDEKSFGIQIDSLCDIVCFGIFPIVLGYKLGMCHVYSMLILAFYGVAGVIRLAYFNVMEEEDQNRDETGAKIYTGLPVTSAALIFPAVLLFHLLLRADLTLLYFGVMILTGLFFLSKIQIKKPQNRGIALLIAFGAVEFIILILKLLCLRH